MMRGEGEWVLLSYDGVSEILGGDLLFYCMVTEGLCAPVSISVRVRRV